MMINNPTIMRLRAIKSKLNALSATPNGLNAINGIFHGQPFTVRVESSDANTAAIVMGTMLEVVNLMNEHADDFVLGIEDTIRMVYLLTEEAGIASIQLPEAIINAVQAEHPDADVRASIDACMALSAEMEEEEAAQE